MSAPTLDNPWAPFESAQQAILTVEVDGGCDTEDEFIAYVRALVVTGMVNSTGSAQRFVADAVETYGAEFFGLEEV